MWFIAVWMVLFFTAYYRYIAGNEAYVFIMPNSDFLINYWPYKYFFNNEYSWQQMGQYVWQFGLGDSLFSAIIVWLDPFRIIATLFSGNIAASAIFVYAVKSLLILIAVYLLAKLYTNETWLLLVCGVPLVFCGMFIYWSTQDINFTALMLVVYQWLGYEKYKRGCSWLWLFLPCLILWFYSFYLGLMFIYFLTVVVLVDVLCNEQLDWCQKRRFIAKVVAMQVISVTLVAVEIVPILQALLQSPRLKTTIDWRELYSVREYAQLLLRGFGDFVVLPEKLRVSLFSGSLWFSSVFLIFSTVAYVLQNWMNSVRLRVVVLLMCGCLLVWPIVVLLFNGFSDTRLRFTWFIIFLLFMASIKFWHNKSISNTLPIFRRAIILTLLIVTPAILYEWKVGDIDFNNIWCRQAYFVLLILFIANYLVSFFAKYSKYAFVLLVIAEVFLNITSFVSYSEAIPVESSLEHKYYFDDSILACQYINSLPETEFFRVDKAYSSLNLNDISGLNENLIQGYRGVKQYTSLLNANYYRFSQELEAKPYYNFIFGFNGRYGILRLLGVKYIISKDALAADTGFVAQKQIGDVIVSRDRNFSGIGRILRYGVKAEEFRKLEPVQKDKIITQAVVVDNYQDLVGYIELLSPAQILEMRNYEDTVVAKVAWSNGAVISFNVQMEQPGFLLLAVPYSTGWQGYVNGKSTNISQVDFGLMGIGLPAGEHTGQLQYTTPGLKIGAIISILAMVMLGAITKKGWLKT